MKPSRQVARWGGAALMLGGALFLVNKLNEISRVLLHRPMADMIAGQDIPLIFLGQVCLVVGFVAFYRVFTSRAQGAAKIGLLLLSGGGVVLAVGHLVFFSPPPALAASLRPLAGALESLFFLVILGVLALVVGLLLFGMVALRRPILGRWKALPLLTGLAGVGFIVLADEVVSGPFLVVRTLFALGIVGLGLVLSLEPRGSAEARSTVGG